MDDQQAHDHKHYTALKERALKEGRAMRIENADGTSDSFKPARAISNREEENHDGS